MKSTIIKACLLTFAGLLIGCAAKQAAAPPAAPAVQPVEVRLGKVIAIDHSTFTLKNEADTERLEKAVFDIWNPAYARHVPGWQDLVCKGDRGVNAGKYIRIRNIDTKERRDYYYPVPDADTAAAYTTAAFEPLNTELAEKWEFESSDFNFSDTVRVYTDYVLVGGDQIAEMPLVGLLGIHKIKVKEGKEAAFEAFITEKYYPAPATLGPIPGFNHFFYKGDRGFDKGGYISVYTFDSVERRDTYIPEPGSISAAGQEALAPFQDLDNELNELIDGLYYTDWVIIK